jgi:hypothetical protein
MRSRRAARGVAAVALLPALALASCGSDDDAQAVAALKSQIVANNAMASNTEISDKQATCIAKGAVDAITVDRLQKYQILDGNLDVQKRLSEVPLSAKDADALAGVYLDCSEAEKIFEDRLVDRLAPAPATKQAVRAKVETCVRDTVTTRSVREILAQSFEKADASAYTELSKQLGKCRA